jgi:hypothetical protein
LRLLPSNGPGTFSLPRSRYIITALHATILLTLLNKRRVRNKNYNAKFLVITYINFKNGTLNYKLLYNRKKYSVDGNGFSFRNVWFFQNIRRQTRPRNSAILNVTHDLQNPLELASYPYLFRDVTIRCTVLIVRDMLNLRPHFFRNLTCQ